MNKRIIYLLMAATLMLPLSCDSFLEEEVFSSFSENEFPTEATVEPMLNRAYQRMGTAVVNNHRMFWGTEFPTPSVHYRFRQVHERNHLSTWSWNNTNSDPAYFELMDRLYDVVRSTNDVIDRVPQITMQNTQRQAEIVGEAQFMRAMSYFYMVRLWGGVPIIDKPQTLTDDLFPARASITDTYAFIISDLQAAVDVLPTRSGYISRSIPLGHITKGAAQGTLAKVYMTMAGEPLNDASNLSAAKDLLDQVINSGEYSLMPTIPEVWDWQNDNNEELLYAIQKEGLDQNFRGIFGYFTPSVPTSGIWHEDPGISRGSALDGVPPEFVKWYASYDSGPRFEWTIIPEIVTTDGDTINMEDGLNAQAYIGKFRAIGGPTDNNFFCPNNFPVLRYADILLLHSEVTNELGAADYTGINAVRVRAELPPLNGLSQEEFRDAVFLERDLELTYEQNMLFDMRRRGLEYTKSKLEGFYNPNQNETSPGVGDGYPQDFQFTIEPHRMLYPYPPSHLEANPNLEQNPGYNN